MRNGLGRVDQGLGGLFFGRLGTVPFAQRFEQCFSAGSRGVIATFDGGRHLNGVITQ